MADFFSRLAERALGAAPVVRPNLPPVFSPAPAIDVSAEFVSAPPAHPSDYASAQNDRRGGVGDPAVTNRSSRSPMSEQKSTEAALRQPMFSPPAVEGGRGITELSPETFEFTAASANSESPRRENFDTEAHLYRSTSAAEPESRDVIAERIVARPARAAVSGSEAFALERSRPAPAVQVTIGRVEVRAVTAPAVTARVPERKSPPLLSLDQYLRERNEGRR
jgi:hypothetical protein